VLITHHHIIQLDPALERWLDRALSALLRNQRIIMTDLTQLSTDVAADTDAASAASTLLANLTQAIKDAGTDPVALKALTDKLEANNAALSAAVAANTPAAAAAQ
jgi:hypothetical protein